MLERLFYKTPIRNDVSRVYSIKQLNTEVIKTVLMSEHVGEGVYSLEVTWDGHKLETYLITPSFEQLPYHTIPYSHCHLPSTNVKEVSLQRPSIFPLDTQQFAEIPLILSKFTSPVLLQCLICKRIDDWRTSAISQYESYLDGNDDPFSNHVLRYFQHGALKAFQKGFNINLQRNSVLEIEEKILSPGFRFECRIVSDDKEGIRDFESSLRKISLYNHLEMRDLTTTDEMREAIVTRSFLPGSLQTILSDSEILSILACEQQIVVSRQSNIEIPTDQTRTPLIDLLPDPVELEHESMDDKDIIKLQEAFKRVGVAKSDLNIIEVTKGVTLNKITCEIPQQINFNDVTKHLKNIQAAMGNENISITIGNIPNTFEIFIPLVKRGVLYLKQAQTNTTFIEYASERPLPIVIGENTSGELLFDCLTNVKHLLVAGSTGSGKSVFLNNLIVSLLINVQREKLKMILIDPKKVELMQYRKINNVEVITDIEKSLRTVMELCTEMETRYDVFSKSGVRNIAQYHKKGKTMPYIVCVIDEYADLTMTTESIEEYVVRLAQKARAAGIHLILCTQKPLSSVVTSLLKANLPSAISFRLKTSSDYMTVFGKSIPHKLLGNGDGVAMIEGSMNEFERFQSPILTLDDEEEEEFFDRLVGCLGSPNEGVGEEVKETPSERIKRLIANTGEVRTTELQKAMNIRMNVVSDLMKDLVNEGWLERVGNKYILVASEDELIKWRGSE